MRPFDIILLLHKIAETVPFELSPGYRTSESHLSLAHGDHFPIASPCATFDVNLLTNSKRVRAENYHWILSHLLPSTLLSVLQKFSKIYSVWKHD